MLNKIKSILIYRIIKFAYLYILYIFDYYKFFKINDSRFALKWRNRHIQLYDRYGITKIDRHYIYHPAWAARILALTNPKIHIDISSTVNFCSLVSAFIPVKFYDYRPTRIELSGLQCDREDLCNLTFENESIESLSCMHVVEHIGLGRYGDPLSVDDDIKAMQELTRVLAVGGNLIFVVPIGVPIIQFNAHRVYSYDMIISYFKSLKLKEFSLVTMDSDKGIIKNASKEQADLEHYACGLFWFVKE